MMEEPRSLSISSDKYEILLRSLSIFRDVCNDIDIRKGMIRQRSNDKTTIIQVDLRSILDDSSLPIVYIKSKLDMIKMFSGNDVTIDTFKDDFKISDQYSSLKFAYPDLDYLDNRFLSQSDLDNIFVLDENKLLVSFKLSKVVTDRMKIVADGFNINTFTVCMQGETSLIKADSRAKDQHAIFVKDVVNNRIYEAETSPVVFPFLVDHDHELTFEMYDLDKFVINKYMCKISDIEIVIYSRSQFAS